MLDFIDVWHIEDVPCASHTRSRGSTPLGTTNNENRGLGDYSEPLFFKSKTNPQHYPQHDRRKIPPRDKLQGAFCIDLSASGYSYRYQRHAKDGEYTNTR